MTNRTIEVTATGRQFAAPDEAVVHVGVVASAADAVTARQQLAEAVATMREALTEIGLADDRLRTVEYSIDHQLQYDPSISDDEAESTQRAFQMFEVVTDPAGVGEVIDTAVTNGANRVERVEFRCSANTRQQLRTTALEDAMAAAREQAETIADSASLSIESVRTVETGTGGDHFGHQLYDTAESSSATVIDAPSVTVVVRVTVVYDTRETGHGN